MYDSTEAKELHRKLFGSLKLNSITHN